jgi:glycosyltransferase involved in cell wall biosynthesis
MSSQFVTVVIPVFNERENLPPLYSEIASSLKNMRHEMIFVDDGSLDGSREILRDLARQDPNVTAVLLSRNFGQTAALAAGFLAARGEIVIPLDGDGQNDPRDIPRLLEKMTEGFDVVSGWRKKRHDAFWSRRVPSALANGVISQVTGVPLHDFGCTLKAYRRSHLANLKLHGEMHRFLPAWCAWRGARITEVEVNHRPRTRGQSKYGIGRTFKVILDLLTTKFFSGYLTKPSYVFGGLGLVFYVVGTASGLLAFYDKLGPDRWPALRIPLLLLAATLGIVGTLLILMGLLAELIVHLYYEVSPQKPYEIAETVSSRPGETH